MIAFKYRFHGHGSLKYVYTHGQSIRSRLLTLKFSMHPKRKAPRVAVVISKKIIKGAIGRNRVRRRVYEIMRLEIPLLKHNCDVVLLIFSPEVLSLPAPELRHTIQQLLREADVYENSSPKG